MADIIGLAAGAAGGGVSRPIAKVTGRIAGPFERRQENAQEQARWKHEAALMELQMKARASELGGGAGKPRAAGGRPARALGLQGGRSVHRRQPEMGQCSPGADASPADIAPVADHVPGLVCRGSNGALQYCGDRRLCGHRRKLWWFGDRGNRREVR